MTPHELERLRQFFGAYFHQDWDLDAPDADGVIDRFIADHSNPVVLEELASLIERYAEDHDDSVLEQGLVSELWCSFLPSASGVRARDWLSAIAARFRAAADR